MYMGTFYKHENSKDSEATQDIDNILDKVEKERGEVLDFRSESG